MRSSKNMAPRRSMRQKPGIWITLMVLLAASGGAWFYLSTPEAAAFPWNPFAKRVSAAAPSYYTATVRRGDIQISAPGSGTLVASQSVDLSFSSGGTVTELSVKLGDRVTAGQTLAKLGNAAALQADVASAELAMVQAQQALDTLQQNAPVSLVQAFQTMITAQQQYNDALSADQRTAYARCSKPVNTRNAQTLANATQKLSDLTQTSYGSDLWIAAKGAYDTALANYTYCISFTPDEKTSASSKLSVARVNLQQAQDSYDTLKAGNGVDPNQLRADQAKLNQAKAQLAQAQKAADGITLVSPINGTVTYLAANQGAMVSATKFITISDESQPVIQISVDQTDIAKLQAGSAVEVTFDAMPDRVFTGKVTQLEPQLASSGNTQVAQGLAVLDDSGGSTLQNMPLGLNATITVIHQQARNTLLVPLQALHDLGDGQYGVFVQGQDGQLQLRVVQVGLKDTTQAQILSGLKAGDVVSTGATQVRQGG